MANIQLQVAIRRVFCGFLLRTLLEFTMSMFLTYENCNQTELDYKRVFLWQMQLNGLTPVLTT